MFRLLVIAGLVGLAALEIYSIRKNDRQMDEFNAAVEAFKKAIMERITAETAEVVKAIDDLKGQVGTGLPKEAVLTALTELSASVEAGIGKIFEPTTPEPPV